jgi:hypothetical protein
MLRRRIALAGSVVCLAFVLVPGGGAQELPPTCEQPEYGLLHAELAAAGMIGSEHVRGLHHRGFSGCVP